MSLKACLQLPTPAKSRRGPYRVLALTLTAIAPLLLLGLARVLPGEALLERLDDNKHGSRLYSRPADGARMVLVPTQAGGDGSRLPAFLIDEKEISQRQYLSFVRDQGASLPGLPRVKQGDDHPVVGVPWADASAYCAWVGARLPSEIEWQQAAGRLVDARAYPWGPAWEAGRANSAIGDDGFVCTAPIGSFPQGASPFGVLDLAGNAEEWVDARDDSGRHIARGGSWRSSDPQELRLDHRSLLGSDEAGQWVGFRCASDTPD